MSQLAINTTQNVNISFTAAGVGDRVLAYLTDYCIKIAYMLVVYGIFFYALGLVDWVKSLDSWSEAAIYLFFYVPVMIYTLVLENLLEGQTLGKRLLKIKVVKIDGYQAAFSDYLVRWFLRLVDITIFQGLIAFLLVALTSKGQRLGDLAAGTAVISLKSKIDISHTILEEIGEEYTPTHPQVIRLSDNDVRIIKDAMASAKMRQDPEELLKLRRKIESVTGILKTDGSDTEFIQRLLRDYNYYTQSM